MILEKVACASEEAAEAMRGKAYPRDKVDQVAIRVIVKVIPTPLPTVPADPTCCWTDRGAVSDRVSTGGVTV